MRRSRRLGAAMVLTGLVVAGVAGCSRGGVALGPGADEREHRIAADPHATAAEIVTAGRPVDVASSHGMTLVAYRVESDDDEGPQQGAWRLYDAEDHPVADGTLGQVREQGAVARVEVVPDGFLVVGYTGFRLLDVDAHGKVASVARPTTTAASRPGDVLLEAGEGWAVYRPAAGTAYRLPRIPFRDTQQLALDDRGTLWVLRSWTRDRIRVAYAAGGRPPWRETVVPSSPNDYPQGLVAENRRVVVPVAHGTDERPRLVGFAVHDTARPDGGWDVASIRGITARNTLDPEVHVLPEGSLLVTTFREGGWLQQPGGGFAAVALPRSEGSEPDLGVVPAGDRLFALPALGRRMWVSRDLGASWKRFRP